MNHRSAEHSSLAKPWGKIPPPPSDVTKEEPTVEDIRGQAERNHLLLQLPHIRCGCTKTAPLSRSHFGKTWQRSARGLASRTGARTDPCRRRPPSLSLTSGALRPLSLQHLISPLNLRLTRSFGSKGLPLCLQPSSTNGAWRGIEGRWRVAVVSAVARWKNQPRGEKREPSEVNRAARGLRNEGASWAEVRARGCEPLFIAGRGC